MQEASGLDGEYMTTLRRIEVIHNAPTPYRIFLFNELARECAERNIYFHVRFMARELRGRPISWRESAAEIRFPHSFHRGFAINSRGSDLFCNPGLVLSLLRQKPDVVILGGLWDSITNVIIAALPLDVAKIAWMEGTPSNLGSTGVSARVAKQLLLSIVDGFIAPGKLGFQFLDCLGASPSKPRFLLPNLVDEQRFAMRRDLGERNKFLTQRGWPVDALIGVVPARAVPDKALPEFFEALRNFPDQRLHILHLGTGEEQSRVQAEAALTLASRYHNIPEASYAMMPWYYNLSDFLLLPSRRDRNPLSVVEGLHCGLPMLLSDQVGNANDAIEAGKNGYIFKFGDAMDLRCKLAALIELYTRDPVTCRARCTELARRSWCTTVFLGRLIESLTVNLASKACKLI